MVPRSHALTGYHTRLYSSPRRSPYWTILTSRVRIQSSLTHFAITEWSFPFHEKRPRPFTTASRSKKTQKENSLLSLRNARRTGASAVQAPHARSQRGLPSIDCVFHGHRTLKQLGQSTLFTQNKLAQPATPWAPGSGGPLYISLATRSPSAGV